MRAVFGLVLIVGLGLAGFAVYMVKGYVNTYQAALAQARAASAPEIETIDIIVADQPLEYGNAITPDAVRLTAFPKQSLPEGVFTSVEDVFSKGENVPRYVLRGMERNEALLAVKVSEPGVPAGISSQLESGMRAFAIKVDVASGVSGFLRPGDRIDVYWTGQVGGDGLQLEGGGKGEVTKLIESSVKLVAVDQVANTDLTEARIARTVTVAARPEQVAALAQAQSTGRLSLSLVGAADTTTNGIVEVDQRELLGIAEAPKEKAAPKPQVCTIRVRRGGEVMETPIPCTN